jgi:hypothetical protein
VASERGVRMSLRAGVMLSIAAAVTACSSSPSGVSHEGSCVSPRLTVTPTQASAGQDVRAHGEWFSATCNDVVSPGAHGGAPQALTGLVIQVRQQGHTWSVASGLAASGEHNTFDAVIRLPGELAPGSAEVAVKDFGTPVTP